jgi:2-keto-4-pentenoate hydratase/2-oxohepta-3-ene-1,7-dioic acid hydratase in catechol pathway
MTTNHWCRIEHEGRARLGQLKNDRIELFDGELFDQPTSAGQSIAAAEARWLAPVQPAQFLGLWNNFRERQQVEGTQTPDFPLFFVKLPGCVTAHEKPIPYPEGKDLVVKFEAELGIVIGKPCFRPARDQINDIIFGYTCVNDVTAGHVLFSNPEFQQWSRSKSWPGFGPIGPVITTGIDPAGLRIKAILDGELKQDYPVSDMIFSPEEIIWRIANEMALYPGDVIACGTSVGAVAMQRGQSIVIDIPGIGALHNTMR